MHKILAARVKLWIKQSMSGCMTLCTNAVAVIDIFKASTLVIKKIQTEKSTTARRTHMHNLRVVRAPP